MNELNLPNNNGEFGGGANDMVHVLAYGGSENAVPVVDALEKQFTKGESIELVQGIILEAASLQAEKFVRESLGSLTGLTYVISRQADLGKFMPNMSHFPNEDSRSLLRLIGTPSEMVSLHTGLDALFRTISVRGYETVNYGEKMPLIGDLASIKENLTSGRSFLWKILSGKRTKEEMHPSFHLRRSPQEASMENAVQLLQDLPAFRFATELHYHHLNLAFEVVNAAQMMNARVYELLQQESEVNASLTEWIKYLSQMSESEKSTLVAINEQTKLQATLNFQHFVATAQPDSSLDMYATIQHRLVGGGAGGDEAPLIHQLAGFSLARADAARAIKTIILDAANRMQHIDGAQSAAIDWYSEVPTYLSACTETASILSGAPNAIALKISRLQGKLLRRETAVSVFQQIRQGEPLVMLPESMMPSAVQERVSKLLTGE